MSKYDFELNLRALEPSSVILRNIKPESTVLEVGCANGRMTQYLKENLNCTVDIAEIDEVAGKEASEWSRYNFLGHNGNVERVDFWDVVLPKTLRYDYIIFADVLEHLVHPDVVLQNSKIALKEGASIWISVPNVAYNGIILELINDQFTYRETGLLDNTHLRFFTMSSLDKMVKKCGFKIVDEQNILLQVSKSEFKDAYTKVPPQVASFLKHRPGGEVYEMVWELKVDE